MRIKNGWGSLLFMPECEWPERRENGMLPRKLDDACRVDTGTKLVCALQESTAVDASLLDGAVGDPSLLHEVLAQAANRWVKRHGFGPLGDPATP